MATQPKKQEDRLLELGNSLASPPSSVQELLTLLDLTDSFLSRVEQSPSLSMLTALKPLMKALVAKDLLKHSDTDVKVTVASCISEITRITAPEAPYDDDLMKEIFQMIVGAFERLDDTSSGSYDKRVSILETVAKVRSCVVMLDLECDDLILEMFRHFLKTIRLDHSENVFSSMETIMTLVIEESEDISPELLSCLLVVVKKDTKEFVPRALNLTEKVMRNCAKKIKPCLIDLIQSTGAPLSDYNEIVSSICQGNFDTSEENEPNVSGEILADDSKVSERTVSDELPQASGKLEQEVACPEKVDTAVDNTMIAVMSNGIAQMGNGDSMAQPTSPKQKPERSRRNGQSKNAVAANQSDRDDVEPTGVKPDDMPLLTTKKVRGRKTNSLVQLTENADHSRTDIDKEAPAVTGRRKGRNKEVDSSHVDGLSGKEVEIAGSVELEKKNEPLRPSGSDNVTLASPAPSESMPVTTRTKRGRPSGLKAAAKRNAAVSDQPASVSGQKDSLGNSQAQDDVVTSKDIQSKVEPEGISDSEGRPLRHSGKKVQPDNAEDGDEPTAVTSDSEVKTQKHTGKNSSGRKRKSNMKPQRGVVNPEKVVAGEQRLKEMVTSPKSSTKTPSEGQSHLEDSVKPKSRRKRARGTDNSPGHKRSEEDLVGSKIEVWWPEDKLFYVGVVDSYDLATKKHKITYADGDIEVLFLGEERWRLAEGDIETDRGKAEDSVHTDAVEAPRSKKTKATPDSVSKQSKAQPHSKSVTESSSKDEGQVRRPKGRPRGGASSHGRSKGKSASDDKAKTSKGAGKLRDEPENQSDDGSPITSSKLKEEPGNKSKEDTPKPGGKTKGDTSKTSGKPVDDALKTSKDDPPKSGRRSKSEKLKDETAKADSKSKDENTKSKEAMQKTTSKSEDYTAGSGSKPKIQTPKAKSRRGTPKSDGDSKENGASSKGKTKVQDSENSAGAQGGEAATGAKKRKRRGRK